MGDDHERRSRTSTGTTGFSVAANTTTAPRTATLSIAEQGFLVTQPSASCTFAVTPSLAVAPPTGGATVITITTQPSCDWTTSTTTSWVTVRESGTGSWTGTFTVTANTGTTTRSAKISVAGVLVTIIQNQPTSLMSEPSAVQAPTGLKVIIKGG